MFPTNGECLIGISDASPPPPLFTGICHLAHVLTVSPTKAGLLCATPAGMDLCIQLHARRHLLSAVPWISEDRLLTAKIYPSTFLLLYMSTVVPVHHYTCSVYLFLFGISSTVTFQLIYWSTYTQIYPKIKLPVYLHASLLSNHNDLPVTTTTCVHAHRSTRSLPYLFILIISFRQTICTYVSSRLLF